jgi:hypothetical protein
VKKYFFINGVPHESKDGGWVIAEDVDELVLGHLAAQHRAAIENTKLRTCLKDVLAWFVDEGFVAGVHYDELSVENSIREALEVRLRCGKCHRPMRGTTAYDGACACGGLIENTTDGGSNK